MSNPFGDLFKCEMCGAFIDAQDTESYTEKHGPGHYEHLNRTKCCHAGYTDLDGQAVVDELKRIAGIKVTHQSVQSVVGWQLLDQTTCDNLDTIQVILEGVFEL